MILIKSSVSGLGFREGRFKAGPKVLSHAAGYSQTGDVARLSDDSCGDSVCIPVASGLALTRSELYNR